MLENKEVLPELREEVDVNQRQQKEIEQLKQIIVQEEENRKRELLNFVNSLAKGVLSNVDRTSRILSELKQMVEKKEVKPELAEKILSLIEGGNNSTINLMDYRRFDSLEKCGYEIVDAVMGADRRQKDKSYNLA